MTPGILRRISSMPQKQPPASVAISRFAALVAPPELAPEFFASIRREKLFVLAEGSTCACALNEKSASTASHDLNVPCTPLLYHSGQGCEWRNCPAAR